MAFKLNSGSFESTLLKHQPIQKFINGIGGEVLSYFEKDKACVIGLLDDGVFYGQGLYLWLKSKGLDINFLTMDNNCAGLEKNKVEGRKILIVDNYVITGTGYHQVMEKLRARRKELNINDLKFAALCDRKNLADFSVEGYTTSLGSEEETVKLDKVDFKIIQILTRDGRTSLAELAGEVKLTGAGVKKRLEKLNKSGILEIKAMLKIDKFYSMSAHLNIKAEPGAIEALMDKLENSPLVYSLTKVYTSHSLRVSMVAPNLKRVNELVHQIRKEPGVKQMVVHIGDLPTVPRFLNKVLFN